MVDVPTTRVVGLYYDADDNPATGSVTFLLSNSLISLADNTTVPRGATVVGLVNGELDVDLVPNDLDGWSPLDSTYEVIVRLDGSIRKRYNIRVPESDLPVNITDLLPVDAQPAPDDSVQAAIVAFQDQINLRLTSAQAQALIDLALEPYALTGEVADAIQAAIAAIPDGLTLSEVQAVVTTALGPYVTLTALNTILNDYAAFIDALSTQDATETAARTDADATLTTNLAQEVSDRIDADDALHTQITAEVTNRGTAVSNEATARSAADSAESAARIAAISAEATTRANADTTLQTNIDSEATTRAAAVTAEAAARVAAVNAEHTGWTGAVAQEILDRSAAVTAEAAARDVAIQAKYDLILGGVGPAFDTLNELATELTSAESATSALVVVVAGKMSKSANLSDVADVPTARGNLGLGSAALAASSAFDPAGAASTVQSLAVLKANNLSDLSSPSTARGNLGLGSAATQASSAFDVAGAAAAAQAASQPLDTDLTAIAALSTTSFGRSFLDRADAAAGRTLLALGSAAILDSGSSAGNLAALSTGGRFARSVLPAATAYTDTAQTFTDTQTLTPATLSGVPLVVQGVASQSGNLTEWRSSTATLLSRVDGVGVGYFAAGAFGPYSGTATNLGVRAVSASTVASVIKGFTSQSADLTQWQDTSSVVKARVDQTGMFSGANTIATQSGSSMDFKPSNGSDGLQFAINGTASTDINPTQFNVRALRLYSGLAQGIVLRTSTQIGNEHTAAQVPLVIKAAASQSGDMTQWQNSSAVVLAKQKANGEYEQTVSAVAASDVGGGVGGLVMKSPTGIRYRATVTDDGRWNLVAA